MKYASNTTSHSFSSRADESKTEIAAGFFNVLETSQKTTS